MGDPVTGEGAGMAIHFGRPRPRALAMRGGTLAAATVLAGAGLLGVATAGPVVAAAPLTQVHHDVTPTAFPTFAESLQTLLNDLGFGDLNQVLAAFGNVPGTSTPLSVSSDLAALLALFNPDGVTLQGVAGMFGTSLTQPLYSADVNVPSVLGTGTLFLVDGVPIGNVDLGELIDVVLGPGSGSHSLTELANVMGMGSMLSQYGSMINGLGLDNFNVLNCTLSCGNVLSVDTHPGLNLNSSLVDWLSGILLQPTADVTQHFNTADIFTGGSTTVVAGSAYTLGEFLAITPISQGSHTMMDDVTLAELFGLTPNQPWDQYLSGLPFGGNVFQADGTWGDQTLGSLLSYFLPDDSTLVINGDTLITDILTAFGLLNW